QHALIRGNSAVVGAAELRVVPVERAAVVEEVAAGDGGADVEVHVRVGSLRVAVGVGDAAGQQVDPVMSRGQRAARAGDREGGKVRGAAGQARDRRARHG